MGHTIHLIARPSQCFQYSRLRLCGSNSLKLAREVKAQSTCWLAVWLSGNALASINVVALRQTRLVLGWVTVRGRVNHFGM